MLIAYKGFLECYIFENKSCIMLMLCFVINYENINPKNPFLIIIIFYSLVTIPQTCLKFSFCVSVSPPVSPMLDGHAIHISIELTCALMLD